MKSTISSFIIMILLFPLTSGQTINIQTNEGTDSYDLSEIKDLTFDYTSPQAYLLSKISTLYPDNSFGLRFFPDLAVTVIHGRDGYPFRMFVVAGVSTYLFEGDSVQDITNVTEVLKASLN